MAVGYTQKFRDVGDLANKVKPDIDNMLHMLDPDNTSMQFLFRKFGEEKATNPVFSHLEDEYIGNETAVNYSTGYASGATSMTVDNGSIVVVGDLLKSEKSEEVLRITAKSSNVVQFAAATNAITDNEVFRIIGNAFGDGQNAPGFATVTEDKITNYCQLLQTAVGITKGAELAENYVGKDWALQRAKKLKEHAWKIERTLIWGEKLSTTVDASSEVVADSGAISYHTGGLWYWMRNFADSDKVYDASGTITEANFIKKFLEPAFDRGSKNKVFFCGDKILSAISAWKLGRLVTRPADKSFDIKIDDWVTPLGTCKLIRHQQLNIPKVGSPVNGAFGFMLDLGKGASPKWKVHSPTKREKVPLSNTVLVQKEVVWTWAGLKMPDVNNHAVIFGVDDYSY